MRHTRSTGIMGAAVVAIATLACNSAPAPHPEAPASIEHAVEESALTTVRLTAEAERRIGIELATAERREVARQRTLGGEILVPPHRALNVSAPVSGTVRLASDGVVPRAGALDHY